MQIKHSLLTLAIPATLAAFFAVGCDEKVTEPNPIAAAAADTARDVYAFAAAQTADTLRDIPADTASTGVATYYSLKTGLVAASDSSTSKWDIAVKGTTVLVNGGPARTGTTLAQVLRGTDFDSVSEAPASGYAGDSSATKLVLPTGSGNGWYNYNGTTNTITPLSGVVLIVRGSDGKYAKVQVLSYYKGNPVIGSVTPTAAARFYTLRVFRQPDGTRNLTPNAAPVTYFSLHTGAVVTDTSTGWDLSFRTTVIKVNGTSQLLASVNFDTLTTAPTTGYGAGGTSLTWYDYSGDPNHTITPKLATALLVKTADGKYAKIQVLSYYKGNPANPNGVQMDSISRYYTFRYFFQSNGSAALK